MVAHFRFYDYIQLGFSIVALVTIPLYMNISYLLYSNRKTTFKTTFYRILLVLTIFDVLSCIFNIFGSSLPLLFFSNAISGTIWGRLNLSVTWFLRISQGITGTLLAINRATAIIYPIEYKRIWPTNYLAYLLYCTLPGYPFMIVIGFADVEYIRDQKSGRVYPNISNDTVRNSLLGLGSVLNIVSILFIVVAYFRSLRTMRKVRRRSSVEPTRMRNGEDCATRIAMIICICEISYFIFIGISSIIDLPTRIFYAIFCPFTDMYSMLNCYVLIAFCKPISNALRKKKMSISFDDNLAFRKITHIPVVE